MTPRPKILLVDDSALVRAVVSHALRAQADVVAIEDPRALAGAIERERPDLLLVDATFPGVDHDALASLVRPYAGERPIVLFSDRQAEVLAALAERVGAVAIVPKEASNGELWPRLAPHLPSVPEG